MGNEKKAAYAKAYYQKNREALIEKQRLRVAAKLEADPQHFAKYRKDYYEVNKERLLVEQRERGKRNYQAKPEAYRVRGRKTRIRSYGLTPEQFEAMLQAQAGLCLICRRPMSPPAIDHDHATGAVRGLLCRGCNSALGLFQDSPEMLHRAAAYLTNSSSGATSTTSSNNSSEPSMGQGCPTFHSPAVKTSLTETTC